MSPIPLSPIPSIPSLFLLLYANLSSMLETFPKSKIKIKQHEENLRMCIRNFIQIYMNKMIERNKDCGIFKFYKLLEKGLPKDDMLFEMIKQEIDQIHQNLEIINEQSH